MWGELCIIVMGVFYLIFRAYLKLSFRFWSKQPVFHWYDFIHYISGPRQLEKKAPSIDEYVNLLNIETTEISEFTNNKILDHVVAFVQKQHASGAPSIESLHCNNHPSFLSTYTNQSQLLGTLTARSLSLYLKGQKELPIYYFDNLCVHRGIRIPKIAPQLLRTTYYRLSRLQPSITAYLFKMEEANTSIVPLVTYTSKVYTTDTIPMTSFPHASHVLIEINKNKLALLLELINIHRPRFDCVLLPSVSNILHMLVQGKWKVYGILEKDQLKAAYIFTSGEKCTHLTGSIYGCEFLDIFQIGFEQACAIMKKQNVVIYNIGDNIRLKMRGIPMHEYPSSYYLYNYIAQKNHIEKTLILH